MTIIKIFLASSEELKHERLVIAEQVANMNRTLANQDITLRLVKWEYLDSSMGAQHKQEDYNDYLVDCDMCFALFWTRFGMYTEIEFEKSLKELNSEGNIHHMSVLFKGSTTKSDELRVFEKKCTEEHPTLCHTFEDDETLKELFNAEVERYISENSHLENEDEIESKSSIQTVRIFLSIDKTLEQERLELTDLVENLNHSLESRNANILMLAWDNSANDNNSFNEEISKTDLCLNLYYTNFNNTTQAELESAYQALCEGKNPKKIYVYFKDGDTVPEKLQEFRDSFPTKYGHFYCSFSNIDTLKADFLLQFMEYQSKNLGGSKILDVNNGKVTLDGKEYVDLKNVPFAGNNEEYNLLLKSIKKTKKLLAITDEDDEEYADYAAELQELNEKLSKMENSLWDTALMITRLSTTKCSERLKRAMDLFTAGDNKGAQAVLNEEEIERDVEHNLHLIQLGEEGKKGLKTNIEEYLLKIRTLENELCDDWYVKVYDIYTRCIELGKNNIADDEYAFLLSDFGDFLMNENIYDEVEDVYNESLSIYRKLNQESGDEYTEDVYWILRRLSNYHMISNEYANADKILNEINDIIKDSNDSLKKGETLYLLAHLHFNQLNHEKAEDELNSALNLLTGIDNEEGRDKLSECLYLMGLLHKTTGKLDLAKEEADKAISIFSIDHIDKKDPFLSRIYELKGHIFSLEGNITSALEMYQKSAEIIRELVKTNPNTYRIHLVCELANLSFNHSLIGDFESAILELHEAEEIITILFEKYPLQYSEYYTRIIHDYAYLLKNTKNYKLASEVIKKSIIAYDILKESDAERHMFGLANTYNLQGCIYLEDVKYDEARESLTLALDLRKELSKKYGDKYKNNVAQTLNNIALLNCNTYQFEDSENQYIELIDLYKYLSENYQQEHDCDIALSYLNLAWLYQKQRQYDKAIKYGLQSIEMFKSVPDNKLRDRNQAHSLLAKALINISIVYFKKKDIDNCLQSINEAIRICEKLSLTDEKVFGLQLSGAYNELAWFKYKMYDSKNAEGLALQSLNIARQHDLKGCIRMSLDTLACIHRELGKTEAAIQEFNECIELCNELHDSNEQFYDGKLAHECIELAKIYQHNDSSKYDSLLLKAKNLLNNLDDNHKMDFKEYFDDLIKVENELK